MKFLKANIPECFFIISILYYWSLTALVINWIAIILLGVMLCLIYFKKHTLGIALGALLMLINLYLILALFSELSEFKEFNSEAWQMLLMGLFYIGLNIVFGSWLMVKHSKAHDKKFRTAEENA